MSNFLKYIAVTLVAGCSLVGCGVGMTPAGGSAEDVKAAFDKMPLEERVRLTNASSIPAEAKKNKIAEMYQKEGKTPPDASGSTAGANTPAPGPPPGAGMPSQGGR